MSNQKMGKRSTKEPAVTYQRREPTARAALPEMMMSRPNAIKGVIKKMEGDLRTLNLLGFDDKLQLKQWTHDLVRLEQEMVDVKENIFKKTAEE